MATQPIGFHTSVDKETGRFELRVPADCSMEITMRLRGPTGHESLLTLDLFHDEEEPAAIGVRGRIREVAINGQKMASLHQVEAHPAGNRLRVLWKKPKS